MLPQVLRLGLLFLAFYCRMTEQTCYQQQWNIEIFEKYWHGLQEEKRMVECLTNNGLNN
jgi:hypothetical protein